jgi:hypothetical protein
VTETELTQWRKANDIPYAKQLPDGRLMGVYRMILDQGRLFLGGNTTGYDQAWDYPDFVRALAAAVFFDGNGDPADGWARHVRAGSPTRRRPFGDPAREYLDTGEFP